jgi:pimeloyl-ACP methyl ester carboxylesterase
VPERYVIFSHGKDGEPWSRKISAMAEIARAEGYKADSLDYRGLNTPRERITKLVEHCQKLPGELVLVGSSLGGYIAVTAASLLHARGLFLLAPALLMSELPPLRQGLIDCPTTIIHGWRDTVVPPEQSVEFARQYKATLHLLDSDHRLYDQLQTINYFFEHFLIAIDLRLGYR